MAVCAAAASQSGCGVRQFNARMPPPAEGRQFTAYGPFLASGQGGESMSPSSCGTSVTGRPCMRARASIGVPYQFDVNTNVRQGPVASGGTTYASPPAPYTTVAGPGYVGPSVGGPESSIFGNKDLSLMAGQVAAGNHVFP